MLRNKKLIVLGSGHGIGAETVRTYAEDGASVAALGYNAEAGQQVLKEASSHGAQDQTFTYQQVDIRHQESVRQAIDAAAQTLGGLDGITVTAGMEEQLPAQDVDSSQLADVFGVNIFGLMFAAAAAFPHLEENGGGSIITYSSGAGMDGFPQMPTYSAAKGAVLAYTRSIATEWGPHHIRANVICPAITTPMMEQFMAEKTPQERQAMEEVFAAKIPLGGKPGAPRDAANVNAFLSSDRGRFITGQTIPVDGGFNLSR